MPPITDAASPKETTVQSLPVLDEGQQKPLSMGYKEVDILITIPIYDITDDGIFNVSRNVEAKGLLTREQGVVMRGITEGLKASKATTPNGLPVNYPGRAVVWLLNQIIEQLRSSEK